MTITSIAIPTHSTSSVPDLHVTYQVSVVDDVEGKYTVSKRYKEFAALDAKLRSASSIAPPAQLPPRTTFWSALRPSSYLDSDFLEERRRGLENYLNALLFGKMKSLWQETTQGGEHLRAFLRDAKKDSVPKYFAKGIGFKGANSYYLHTFAESDRIEILNTLQADGFTVIRIFISQVGANNKGSNNQAVNDLEPTTLGEYDDTILELIDQLMYECSTRGLKLIIAIHDRYALGFWSTDTYATTLGIAAQGSSGAQQITDADAFYTEYDGKYHMDLRIDHVLNHTNSKMSNQRWGDLGSVIYAFEAENEPMGYMTYYSAWIPDRSGRIKQNLGTDSGILVSNGGGVDVPTSTTTAQLTANNVDIVCVHTYDTNPWSSVPTISTANGQAQANGKQLIVEEWGADGSSKGSTIYAYVEALYDYGISWLYWEVVIPSAGTSNFEIWTDDAAWGDLVHTPTGE